MCVTLLTSARDDDLYVIVLILNETTIGRYVFILATARDETAIGSIQR